MITAQDIKEAAKRMGADLVGIGSIDRWSTAPIQMDSKQIMPNAKSVIALGFRVLRGSLRGIEEGTYPTILPWVTVALPICTCL